MSNKFRFISGAAAVLLVATASTSVQAGSSAGAFIGGVFASKIMGNMNARTQAEQQQAYYAQQGAQRPVQQAAPASSTQTTEQKLDELNKLAAGGYITPAEYKEKKQAIINSL